MLGNTNITIKPNEKVDYVDWIESTGTQYIDTGYYPGPNTKVEIDFQFSDLTVQQRLFSTGENADFYYQCYINGNGYYAFAYQDSSGNWISTGITVDTNRHTVILDGYNKIFTIDDIYSASLDSYTATATSTATLNLLCYNTGNPLGKGKLYGSKIYENDILIHSFRPCKDSTGIFCLYDTITKKYFYNKGTGYFEGPNPLQVEYIEGSSSQYIDTGIKNSTTIRTVCCIAFPSGETFYNGSEIGGNNGRFKWGHNGGNNLMIGWGTSCPAYAVTGNDSVANYHIFDLSQGSQIIKTEDGVELIKYTDTTLTKYSTDNIYLFKLWLDSSSTWETQNGAGRIKYCQFYDNGTLVRDFIPVYIGIFCLYDTVNKKYYYNKGTGVFTGADSLFSGNTVCLLNFEDNLIDDTGLNAVTMSTGEATYVNGKFNKSLDLNKTAYATFPLTTDNTLGTNDFTIAGWFKLDDISQSTCLWSFSHYVNSSYYWQGIQVWYNAKFCFCCDISSSSKNRLNTSTTITAGTWHHVALVRSSGTVKLYLDGTSIGSLSASGTVYQNTACNWKIGSSSVYSEYPNIREGVTGQVDNFMILNGIALWTENFTPSDSPYGTSEV